MRSHEPAAAGPNSGHRGKPWHRCCVLPTQCLHGSLRGWWSRIRCLSCAGNGLCPLHPSVKRLSTEAVFAVGEMPLKTLLICQEGVSSIQVGALMVERGQTQFQPCRQGKEPSPAACCSSLALLRVAGTKSLWRFQSGTTAPTQPCMLCRNEAKLTEFHPAPRSPGLSYFMAKLEFTSKLLLESHEKCGNLSLLLFF